MHDGSAAMNGNPRRSADVAGPSGERIFRLLTQRVLLPLTAVLLFAAIWQGMIVFYGLPVVVLPSPLTVLQTFVGLLGMPAFWRDVATSLYEFVVGYALGVVFGVSIGMLMGESRYFRMIATPVIESLRFIVPFAWIPLTVLWFGTSYTGKIVLVFYAVFFVMVVSTATSISRTDPTLSRVGVMLGMSPWRLAFKVHLRAAAPSIASAARAAAAVGWIAVLAAEYVGASAGLGVMITNAATSLATATVMAGMIAIGFAGAGVSALISWLSRSQLDYL
jgi:ABC-type nitrate/sulfonate/bicarbonate transport system permease component